MIKKLWRLLFPVRIRYVMNYIDTDFDQNTDETHIYHELTTAQEKCPEMFTALGIELMRLEALIHANRPINSQDDLIAWAVNVRSWIKAANVLKGRMALPSTAAIWLSQKQEELEKKKDGEKNADLGDYEEF